MKSVLQKAFCFLLLAILIYACAINPVTGKKELMIMSEAEELALGKQSDPSIIATYGYYPDSTLQRFIRAKGQEMAEISHRANIPYSFKVVDSPVVNAFAVPGGYVYFTRGIMGHFNNEAEFAGVLGHEIGHIAARHSAKQYTKQTFAQLGLGLGMLLSSDFREFSDVASTGMQLLFLKFGRDMESQSDELGVEYSSKIGYDAHEMSHFFSTLNRLSGGEDGEAIPTFLSTHPNPANRQVVVKQMASEYQSQNPGNYAVNRQSYLDMIDGIVHGEDPRQGYIENNTFYHPELKFSFPIPQSWMTNNLASMIQMGPSNGKALMVMTLASESNLQDAARNVATTDNLTIIESANRTVNGFPAIAMISTDQENTIKVLSYLIQYDNLIYKFHGFTETADFNEYFNLFEYTMKNFRRLTDYSKINVKPVRIRIVNAKKNGTLQSNLAAYNMNADQQNELSILNGMKLTEQVQAGTRIKILGS